jgi:hypothetical protein
MRRTARRRGGRTTRHPPSPLRGSAVRLGRTWNTLAWVLSRVFETRGINIVGLCRRYKIDLVGPDGGKRCDAPLSKTD